VRVGFASSPFGTPRHRCDHPVEQLRAAGIEAAVIADGGPLTGFTHAVLNRVPMTAAVEAQIAAAEAAGTRVLFDVDDLLFAPELVAGLDFVASSPDPGRVVRAAEGIAATVARCGAGLCATPALRGELAARGARAEVALNGVSDEMVALSERARGQRPAPDGRVRIGFPGGHPGHAFNVAVVEEALERVLREYPHVELLFIGPVVPAPRLAAHGRRVQHTPYLDWRVLPFQLARLDVCIAPLADHRFNRCKSDIKWMEAALVGVPLVASPVGQLGETIHHGVNGLLASGPDAWVEALGSLLDDPALGARLAAAAGEEVQASRTSAALGPVLAAILGRLAPPGVRP
jgi:glycosyltransferase involved in cell wall biosynthesis